MQTSWVLPQKINMKVAKIAVYLRLVQKGKEISAAISRYSSTEQIVRRRKQGLHLFLLTCSQNTYRTSSLCFTFRTFLFFFLLPKTLVGTFSARLWKTHATIKDLFVSTMGSWSLWKWMSAALSHDVHRPCAHKNERRWLCVKKWHGERRKNPQWPSPCPWALACEFSSCMWTSMCLTRRCWNDGSGTSTSSGSYIDLLIDSSDEGAIWKMQKQKLGSKVGDIGSWNICHRLDELLIYLYFFLKSYSSLKSSQFWRFDVLVGEAV